MSRGAERLCPGCAARLGALAKCRARAYDLPVGAKGQAANGQGAEKKLHLALDFHIGWCMIVLLVGCAAAAVRR